MPTEVDGGGRGVARVGQAVSGEGVSLEEVRLTRAELPLQSPNAPFLLAVHPNRWCVAGGVLVPSFATIKVEAGIEGIAEPPPGEKPSYAEAVARFGARGFTAILNRHGPPGPDGAPSVLRRHKVKVPGTNNDGVFYATAWDTLYANDSKIDCDHAALGAWIWDLVAKGIVPPPSLVGLRRELDRLVGQLEVQRTRALSSERAKNRAKEIELAIGVLEAEIERQEAARRPASAKGKKGKSSDALVPEKADGVTLD